MAACSVVAVVLLAVGLVAPRPHAARPAQVTDLLRTETAPVLDDLRDTIEAANYEIVRLDGLVSTAESVTGTVDSASPARLHRHGQPRDQGRGLRQRHGQGGPPPAGRGHGDGRREGT